MKTYREFINEVAKQSTPRPSLVDPQLQTRPSVTRPSLMQQAQDLRAMRLRAIERQGGRKDEAQRLRTQLSAAQQKVSDTRAAELNKVRQSASDQTIARSQNPVRNRTNTSNTTNTANNNNNNQQRRNNKVAQVPGEPRLGRSGFRGIDNSNLRDALLQDIDRLQDVKNRWQDFNQQNPPSRPQQQPKPQQQQQQQPKPQTPSTTQEPKGKPWWQDIFGNPEETKPETKPETKTEPKTETETNPKPKPEEPKPETKTEPKTEPKSEPKSESEARQEGAKDWMDDVFDTIDGWFKNNGQEKSQAELRQWIRDPKNKKQITQILSKKS